MRAGLDYAITKVPLREDNANLKEIAKLELTLNSRSNAGLPQTLEGVPRKLVNKMMRDTARKLINNNGVIYAAKLKSVIIAYDGEKASGGQGCFYVADPYKGNGIGSTLHARAVISRRMR